ncbi:MAG TPA: HNH endonuclease family protein [Rubrobacteraceae bacterium]|nr:HNH endonuclease family protein [Rubrobacteraceae bacterium]
MSRRRQTSGNPLLRIAVVVIVVAAAAFGLIELDIPQDLIGGSVAEPGRAPAEPSRALEDLEVAPEGSMAGYSREEFPHWSDADEFGWEGLPSSSCDVRDAALIRDGTDVRLADGCDVVSGRWRDPYAGGTYSNPSEIDIDHVVPLANAWRSGADSWNEELRERYANDPSVLLSVEAGENRSKGDKGPEAWKPPNRGAWCEYATRWIRIKAEYDLSVNEGEESALQQMLGTCEANGS